MRIFSKSLIFQGVALACLCVQLSNCKLTGSGLGPDIYPTAGSTDVPVNTVIEIQYPKTLGITEKDISPDLFSVQECELNTFSYLDPTKNTNPLNPTQPKQDATTSTKKDQNGNPIPDPNDGIGGDASKKIGDPLHTWPRTMTDAATGTVFAYLVIDPVAEISPLKPGHTYCVTAKGIHNQTTGVELDDKEISFTAEKSAGMHFGTRFDAAFYGKTIAPKKLSEDGKVVQEDYVLLYLDGQPVRPVDVKNHIRLCIENQDQQLVNTENCNDFNGRIVDSDVRMIVPLQSDQNQHIPARYNLYAISAHGEMKAGEKYRIILNRDMGKGQDTDVGESPFDFDVEDQNFYGWRQAYGEQIKDSAGSSIVAKNQLIFYIGSGSTTATSTPSQAFTKPVTPVSPPTTPVSPNAPTTPNSKTNSSLNANGDVTEAGDEQSTN